MQQLPVVGKNIFALTIQQMENENIKASSHLPISDLNVVAACIGTKSHHIVELGVIQVLSEFTALANLVILAVIHSCLQQ